jgi:glycerophosphoryl diester phosphodiesterase
MEQEKAARWIGARNAAVVHWPTSLPPVNRAELRDQFRAQCGIPADARTLLFLGRLHSMKRVSETVASFCAAEPRKCHLVIAGPDGDVSARAIVAEIHARGRCVVAWTFADDRCDGTRFTSPQAEIEAAFAAGVDAVFTDFPRTGVAARDAFLQRRRGDAGR